MACDTPYCQRTPTLEVTSAEGIYELVDVDAGEVGEAELCLQCTIVFIEGHKRHPGETKWSLHPMASSADREKVGQAFDDDHL